MSDDLPLVIVVHGRGAASAFDVLRAARRVARITFMYPGEHAVDARDRELLAGVDSVDTAGLSPGQVVEVARRRGARGVVTFSENLVGPAAELARALGLPGLGAEAVVALTSKLAQRTALRAAGVQVPRFMAVRTQEDLRRAVREIGYPAIIKPIQGAGSRHTYAIEPGTRLRDLWDELAQPGGGDGPEFLVEQRLPGRQDVDVGPWGDYVSVETATGCGRRVHLAVTGRRPLQEPFRESGAFVPAVLSEELTASVLREAERALDALGVNLGLAHTEVKLTPHGPRVIEVNGRLGGYVGELLRMQSPSVDAVAEALRLCLGRCPSSPTKAFAVVSYVTLTLPPVGARRVAGIEGVREAGDIAGVTAVAVVRGAGEDVNWRLGTEQHVARVWGTARDHDDARARLAEIDDVLRVRWL